MKRPQFSWRHVDLHALLCLIIGVVTWWFVMVSTAPLFSGWRDWLVLYALAVCTFYLGIYGIARMLLTEPDVSGKKLMRLSAQLLVALLSASVVFSWSTGALSFGFSEETRSDTGIKNLIEVAAVLAVSLLVAYFVYSYRWGIKQYFFRLAAEAKLRGIEDKLMRIQQSWVQQDLPPHLLFNALGAVRALMRENTAQAREAITLLAGLAKYYVKKCKQPEIPLAEELEQFGRLRRLYALRFGRDLALDIYLPDEVPHMTVIPMLLIVLLENMATHGIVTNPDRPARLTISRQGNRTEIITQNDVARAPGTATNGLGIAINNIRKQLQLRYPNKSGLEIIQSVQSYSTRLFFAH